jgi:hypothetical protein
MYFNKLTLNFKSIMDEQEAGELPNKAGSKTSAQKTKKGYVNDGAENVRIGLD